MDGIEVGRHRTGEGRGAFFVVFPSPSPSSFPGRVSVSFLLPTSPPGPLFSFFLPFAILHARVKEYRVTRLYYTILYYLVRIFLLRPSVPGRQKGKEARKKGGKKRTTREGRASVGLGGDLQGRLQKERESDAMVGVVGGTGGSNRC